jgi:hypothetical protein
MSADLWTGADRSTAHAEGNYETVDACAERLHNFRIGRKGLKHISTIHSTYYY